MMAKGLNDGVTAREREAEIDISVKIQSQGERRERALGGSQTVKRTTLRREDHCPQVPLGEVFGSLSVRVGPDALCTPPAHCPDVAPAGLEKQDLSAQVWSVGAAD